MSVKCSPVSEEDSSFAYYESVCPLYHHHICYQLLYSRAPSAFSDLLWKKTKLTVLQSKNTQISFSLVLLPDTKAFVNLGYGITHPAAAGFTCT